MPTREEAWPEGTPNWIELTAVDAAAAAAYYGELFGWVSYDTSGDGAYLLAFRDGQPAAAIVSKQLPEVRAHWSTYFAVEDADAVAGRVIAAGGETHCDPLDVGPNGRMLVASSPDGARFGVWEAGDHIGVGIYNEPGTLAWNTLHSTDLDAARSFYADVFDFAYQDLTVPSLTYVLALRASDESGIGALTTNDLAPPGTPSHWLTWFAVDGCDESAIMACRLGGRVLIEPEDTPFGRAAVVSGPEGEVFGLVDLSCARRLVLVPDVPSQ